MRIVVARWRCSSSARLDEVGGQGRIGAEVQVDVAHQGRADREPLGPRGAPVTVADGVETRDGRRDGAEPGAVKLVAARPRAGGAPRAPGGGAPPPEPRPGPGPPPSDR